MHFISQSVWVAFLSTPLLAAYGVYILPPIPTEGLTPADAGSLMEQTHTVMSEVFDLTTSATKEDLWMDLRERQKLLEHGEGQEQKE